MPSPTDLPGWLGYAVLGVVWAATVFGWLLDRRKKTAEIAKLQLEAVTEGGKSLEHLQQLRRGYEESLGAFREVVSTLVPLLRDHSDEDLHTLRSEVVDARDRACAILFEQTFPRLREWAEHGCLMRKHEPEKLERFLREEIAEELENIPAWLRTLNLRRFVGVLELAPAAFSGTTLATIRNLALDLPSSKRRDIEQRLEQAIQDILAAGTPPPQ